MAKPDETIPAPVRPPTLPPDFPDIAQNPPSELQPPPEPSASPDKVAGTIPDSGPETEQREHGKISAMEPMAVYGHLAR
jgi:hypothetical protein